MNKKMKKIMYVLLMLIGLTLIGCNDRNEDNYHVVELKVNSTGDFKVWYNYSRNPEANADYLVQPPTLYNKTFYKKISLKKGDFYTLKVTPTTYYYTAQVVVDGVVVDEKYSNSYVNIDRTLSY
jgi:uncharacterized lipoprotein NlpE involved in copper resistance